MGLRCSSALLVLLCALLQTVPSDATANPSVVTPTTLDFEAGHERMRKTARHYEVVDIDTSYHRGIVSRRRRSAGLQEQAGIFKHPERSSFTVNAFGKRMHLDLRLQTDLLPDGYEYQYYKENGDLVREKSVEHCYYQGEVLGLGSATKKDSFVAVSTCNGLSGVFGSEHGVRRSSGLEQYHIEPFLSRPAANGTHLHVVYQAKDVINEVGDDLAGDASDDFLGSGKYAAEAPRLELLQRQAERVSARVRRQAASSTTSTTSTTTSSSSSSKSSSSSNSSRNATVVPPLGPVPQLVIKQAIVMDYWMYKRFRTSTSHTIQQYTLELLNLANSLLKPLNVSTVVVGIRVFTSIASTPPALHIHKDQRPGLFDFVSLFTRWSDTELNRTLSFDSAAFITDSGWNRTLAYGAAYLYSMCRHNGSGFIMKTRQYITQTAGTFVHELGHQLGILHNDKYCQCSNFYEAGGCLMDPRSGRGIIQRPAAWSNCSTHALQYNYHNDWLKCIERPEPATAAPSCGNGYLEGDEECDCGPELECEDVCCNATTCRLADGAVCSSGPCCDQELCQYRASGHVCRPAVPGGCDVAETCPGDSTTCPADLHEPAGTPCNGSLSSGYCNLGLCRNRDDQCKRVWSHWSDQARSAPTQPCYHTCPSHTITTNCGLNLCRSLACLTLDGPQPDRFYSVAYDNHSCSYFFSAVYQGPEFVDDYSSCGEGMWCQSLQCVPIHATTGRPGPTHATTGRAGREDIQSVTLPAALSSQSALPVVKWLQLLGLTTALVITSVLC